jgi:hypothetical protein
MEQVVICPHCGLVSEIEELNCGIFRCGYYCDTLLQIPPHLSQQEGELLVKEHKIYGCAKAWKFVNGRVMGCGYE